MGKTHVTLGDRTTNWTHFHCELGALVGLGNPKGLCTAAPSLMAPRPE